MVGALSLALVAVSLCVALASPDALAVVSARGDTTPKPVAREWSGAVVRAFKDLVRKEREVPSLAVRPDRVQTGALFAWILPQNAPLVRPTLRLLPHEHDLPPPHFG